MANIFDDLDEFSKLTASWTANQLKLRDAEIHELRTLVDRLKRKAQNNIDRAYNRGVRDARAEECGDGTCAFRVVRHAEEFGRD